MIDRMSAKDMELSPVLGSQDVLDGVDPGLDNFFSGVGVFVTVKPRDAFPETDDVYPLTSFSTTLHSTFCPPWYSPRSAKLSVQLLASLSSTDLRCPRRWPAASQ